MTTTASSTYSTISVNSTNNNSNNVPTQNMNRLRNCSTTMTNLLHNNNTTTTAAAAPTNTLGLIVTAKQIYYPIELSNSELLSHYEMIQEYQYDIASNIIQNNSNCKPSLKLINQQPDLNPVASRPSIINFLYKLAKLTRVTQGIYFQSIRLFDRYCSKRIVLKDQINLILGTCLWLAAKTYGGCNHIINNVVVPTGGRFYGPNPRARIPRLNELVYFCQSSGDNNDDNGITLDESMFCQMEKHILDTLNWEISEPMFNDYILNVDENCLIQYELYQRQSNTCHDDHELNDKIQLIHLKCFLMDLTTWNLDLLDFELFELTHVIFHLINRFTNESDQSALLDLPIPSPQKQSIIFNTFIESITNVPDLLMSYYKDHSGVIQFINNIKLFILQSKQSLTLSINTSTHSLSPQSIPSPVYSTHNPDSSTPSRNVSGHSENSIFSSLMVNSPLTPTLMVYDSSESSSLSLGKRDMIPPPRSKFLNSGVSLNQSNHSSQNSLISLTVGQ